MSRNSTILVLFLAAVFEAGGDALVRIGLRTPALWSRAALFLMGSVVLFSYAWTVNAPPWDFGRLIGVYVAVFFISAQVINRLRFGHAPGLPIYAGGALIVAGGLVMTLWKS